MMISWSKVKTNQNIRCTLLKQNKKNWVRAYLIYDFKQQFLEFKTVIQKKKKKELDYASLVYSKKKKKKNCFCNQSYMEENWKFSIQPTKLRHFFFLITSKLRNLTIMSFGGFMSKHVINSLLDTTLQGWQNPIQPVNPTRLTYL